MSVLDEEGCLELVVNGMPYKIDIDEELEISDIDEDMRNISAKIAFWGAILAEAEREKVLTDAYYRRWRAQTGEEFLETNPKLAEWKIKMRLEATEQFEVLKKAIALAAKNVVTAKTLFDAFCRKANMLQSKGAMLRHELNSDDMSVNIKEEKKVEAMKKSFKKRSKKNG